MPSGLLQGWEETTSIPSRATSDLQCSNLDLVLAVKAHVWFAIQILTFPFVTAFCCYRCGVCDFLPCAEGKMWKL